MKRIKSGINLLKDKYLFSFVVINRVATVDDGNILACGFGDKESNNKDRMFFFRLVILICFVEIFIS